MRSGDNAMKPPKTILVVDDDVDILRLAREALSTIEGCTIDTTPNAEYAFELVLKKPCRMPMLAHTTAKAPM